MSVNGQVYDTANWHAGFCKHFICKETLSRSDSPTRDQDIRRIKYTCGANFTKLCRRHRETSTTITTYSFKIERIKSDTSIDIGANTPTEYKSECIVDSSKEPTVDGNYKDCTTEAHVTDGSTDCCKVDGVLDCCNKSASYVSGFFCQKFQLFLAVQI